MKLLGSIKYISVVFFCLLAVGIYSILVTDKYQLHLYLNQFHTPFFDYFFKYTTWLGDGIFFGLVIVFVFFWNKKYVYLFLFAGLITIVLTYLMKNYIFFNYPRPYKVLGEQLHIIDGVKMRNWHSFPSGHATSAFVLFSLLIFISKKFKWQIVFLFFAVIAGLSRVYLSQHYLEDVIGGSVIGVLIALISYNFAPKINLLNTKKSKKSDNFNS